MVFVDTMRAGYRGMVMCHCIADSTEELLQMMDKIGVQRKWIQKAGTRYEHFDICLSKRALAIKNGAIEISQMELGRKIVARRKSACDPGNKSTNRVARQGKLKLGVGEPGQGQP
jgi:hypothetical protein